MIIQSFFGSAQTGLGYQFYDDTGTLLGSRITAGISTGPESGAYVADATIPAGAVGVYWDSDDSKASEDLREAIAAESILADTDTTIPGLIAALNDITVGEIRTELATELARIDAAISSRLAAAGYTTPDSAASIADAVWDEAIADHQSAGSTGEQLAAAGASGDPWAATVPASYADGTAGAAVGRLNNTPPAAPIVVLPDPSADSDLCVCYVDSETMTGTAVSGLEINIDLASDQPALSDQGKVVTSTRQTMAEDVDNAGRYILALEKGLRYVAKNLTLFGVDGQSFSTASKSTLDIGSL